MNLEKLFEFTKQLEKSLEKFIKIPNISDQKKDDILKKIELISYFNQRFLYNKNSNSKINCL